MLCVLQFPEMNKTLKNTPRLRGLKWKEEGNRGLPSPGVRLWATAIQGAEGEEGGEGSPGFEEVFLRPRPGLGKEAKEAVMGLQEKAKTQGSRGTPV